MEHGESKNEYGEPDSGGESNECGRENGNIAAKSGGCFALSDESREMEGRFDR